MIFVNYLEVNTILEIFVNYLEVNTILETLKGYEQTVDCIL
jgi:hypothetical protein